MYLKRIVLHGFKSFADRTEFDFGPGLTMVVGPNGCGKSNLLDALRWVLGEQSARSLRGQRMSDVIFAGSRSRKPANAASVELTFDNRTRFLATDEPEVTVARVLYRNGDSEYRLNGQSCRLKDIRHLFLDTGVGVDAYSIIEQGRVDQLLQANPLERREIFEEAAGISRYKVQRAEAQRKLERTQNNLLRLNDVIDELEKRLRSVKLAAGKARRWQEYDARLRERRATFALAEYHELVCTQRQAQVAMSELHDRLAAARAELAATEAEAAEHAHALQGLDEQIAAAEARLARLNSESSTLAERLAQGQRRLAELAALRDRRQAQSAEFADRRAALAQRLEAETTAQAALAEACAQSTAGVAALHGQRDQAAAQRDQARAALERTRAAAFEAVRQSALLHNEQSNLAGQAERLQAQMQRSAGRRADVDRERGELAQQHEQAAGALAALDQQIGQRTAVLRDLDGRLAELAEAGVATDQQIGAAKETRSAVQSRIELLEDLERRREGIDQGTQAVLLWRGDPEHAGGVLGLVADLLRIDDPRVGLLQPVLSAFEDHVVVADTYAFFGELARRAALPGPVHALALDRLPREIPRAQYDTAPGFVGRAADWVACAPEHRALAEHLLGRVIIVDVLERALALAAAAPDGYVFVTLDGRTIGVDGRLVVGAAQARPGLISRKAEIRQLHSRLDEVETTLEQATRRRARLADEASDAQLQRGELLARLAELQRAHADARAILTRLAAELARAEREQANIDAELHVAQRSLDELEAQACRLAAEAQAAGSAQRDHEAQLVERHAALAELEAAVTRLAQELTEAQVAAGRLAEKQAAGAAAVSQAQAALEALGQEQAAAEREGGEAAGQIAAQEAELAAARTRQAACALELQAGQSEVWQHRTGRQEIKQRLEAGGTRGRAVQETLHALEGELHAREVARRETEVRQEALVARLRDDLQLDLVERYASYQHAEQDWDAVRAEIAELREKIARLGNVNLDDLAELEELTPRYENLSTQRADLLDSLARLTALIAELDQESRSRFAATFEQIRTHFQELFRKLFGGGKADILLEDPEQPLECGIDIVARPPGKEPQSLTLLSGGEKTMTAVALLMAVFQSKPSPFAFLDEVDAALDEANTERFNTLLQEFLAHSQFVVITHSKRTMQCADVLYGVTMEEPGVSQRVSVRFEERVPTPNVA